MKTIKAWVSDENRRYVLILFVTYLIIWVILGLKPFHRADWALENALPILVVPLLAATYRRFPFSRVSYTLIFIFLILHTIGSHYTYAEVPYNQWSKTLFGTSLNEMLGWERNHFDRLVHFLYGLLIAYPIREIYVRIVDVRGLWGYSGPLMFTMATSMSFELIEWMAALIFGGELEVAYLGTQGDVWDAQKDMFLAILGALIAMTITALLNYRYQRDFAQEWADSLTVKHPKPLGEERFRDLMREETSELDASNRDR